jgi:hypothetical protein
VDWAIRRAMSAEPDRRPSSCREFLEDLTGQSRNTPTRLGEPAGREPAVVHDIWYMVYKDDTGAMHTVKGSTEGIRNALAGHLLGDAATILVSRTKTGNFQALISVPEFRDLVIHPAQLPAPPAARLSGVLSKASGVAPPAMERRPSADPETIDVGGSLSGTVGASASRRQPPTPRSGRYAPADTFGPSNRTPGPPSPVTLAVEAPADPQADTVLFAEAIDSRTEFAPPMNPAGNSASPALPNPSVSKPPRDWTPILVVQVMILTVLVVYLLLTR